MMNNMKNNNDNRYIILYRKTILTILIGMLLLCIVFLVVNISRRYMVEKESTYDKWNEFPEDDFFDENILSDLSSRSITNDNIPYDGQYREISCWGDSMTYGTGSDSAFIYKDGEIKDISYCDYPSILEELTGINTYNFGVPGATSQEIAVMQGGLKWYECDIDLKESNIDVDIMQEAIYHKDDILILEIGSNGGWNNDYESLIQQYDAMIKSCNCSYYIIIGDTDNPGSSLGDLNQTSVNDDGRYIGMKETAWEAALHEAYGEHFLNMRTYLIKNGLKDVGLKSTSQDRKDAKKGFISEQLKSDWTHFNAYGYYSKALAVYKKGVELGYWE